MNAALQNTIESPAQYQPANDIGRWVSRSGLAAPARIRLICFPYAGGGPWIFSRWSAELGRGFQVCPVHLPGRGARFLEKPLRSLKTIAAMAADALAPELNKPFAVFGHSFGGLAAFEFARALRRMGGPQPIALIASASSAPQLQSPRRGLHQLDEQSLLSALEKMGGTPACILEDKDYMRSVLPTLRADFEAIETYTYEEEPPLDCRITAIGGREDRLGVDQLAAWADQTKRDFKLRILPGGHFFLSTHETDLLSLLTHELSLAMSLTSAE